jgi:hypothetical protein
VSFVASASDMSLFVYKEWDKVAYFLLYIDDSLIYNTIVAHHKSLHSKFSMIDLDALHLFLCISVTRFPYGMFSF